jgi:hypothetical protein
MRLRTFTLVSIVLLTSLFAGLRVSAQATTPGSAPSEEQRKEASGHFRRGVELFQEGAYRAALVEFEKAYAVSPDYRLLYNIGQTKLQLQDYLGATQSYEGYLTEGGADVSPARREDVEKQLEALRERVGRMAIVANRDGADVFVDDLKVGVTPMPGTVSVNVGRHRVYAHAADGAQATQVLDVAGGELVEVKLELVAPKIKQQIVRVGTEKKEMPMLRKVAIATWAAGAGLAAGAVVMGLSAQSSQDDLDKKLDQAPNNADTIGDLRDSISTKALVTDLMGGLAIAAGAAGVVCWFLAPKDDAKKDKQEKEIEPGMELGFGPTSIFARGRF